MLHLPKIDSGKTKFYFAFPDRIFHYDCATCDALCCRGHGIGTTTKETPYLLNQYPELAWAATKNSPTGSDFTNPAGGCFFLTTTNRCQIEEQHGRKAKPGVCVLFPFNDFSRLGDVIVVRPHFLCPLRLLPGKGVGRHAELEALLHETGVVTRALGQPGPDLSPSATSAAIRREEIFRDKCGAEIGVGRFEALIESEAEDKTEFRRWQERSLRLWGILHEKAPRDYLDDILLALAPAIRMRAVLVSEQKRLRILFLAGAYVRNVAHITSRPLTLQGTHQMIVNIFGVLRLFARGNAALHVPSNEIKRGVDFQNPELTLSFFQVLEDLQAGKKLFDALEQAIPDRLSKIERTMFYHQLAQWNRDLRRNRD